MMARIGSSLLVTESAQHLSLVECHIPVRINRILYYISTVNSEANKKLKFYLLIVSPNMKSGVFNDNRLECTVGKNQKMGNSLIFRSKPIRNIMKSCKLTLSIKDNEDSTSE